MANGHGSTSGRGGPRGPQSSHGGSRHGAQPSSSGAPPLFDPAKPLDELVDALAEQQAALIPGGRDGLQSSQLRRFFGDVKELYRRLEQNSSYDQLIKPMFKMIRSKAAYAWRNGDRGASKIPREFYEFLDKGIAKVQNESDFRKFVQHFEAVVGFLYGTGKVGR